MGIRISTLANGLRVATDPMDSVETASVGVWIEAGSRYETATICGVSHFLEHMVFKGTRRRDARAIAEEIEAVGGHLNAHTSREYTAFYAKVLKEDVPLAVDIIADILQDATLDDGELGRERTVILQEIMQAQDTPDDIIFDRFQETAFPEQARAPGVGLAGTDFGDDQRGAGELHARPMARRGWCSRRPGGSTTTSWSRSPRRRSTGCRRPSRGCASPPAIKGGTSAKSAIWSRCIWCWAFRDRLSRSDFYPVSVLSTLLGGGMSSRLFQEAREKRGLVYSIYTFPTSYTDSGVFGIYAGTGENEVEELIPLVCDELGKVEGDVSDAEISRARAQLKSGMLMALGEYIRPLRAARPPAHGVWPADPNRGKCRLDRSG